MESPLFWWNVISQWRYLSSGKLVEQEQVVSDDEEEMEFEVKAAVSDEKYDSDIENELSTKFGRGNSEVKVDKTGVILVSAQNQGWRFGGHGEAGWTKAQVWCQV